MKLPRKQFVSSVKSRVRNKSHALASSDVRFWKEKIQDSHNYGAAVLVFLKTALRMTPTLQFQLPADNLACSSNPKHEKAFLRQTLLMGHGNGPGYLLRGKRKTFVNIFSHHLSHLKLPMGVTSGGKRAESRYSLQRHFTNECPLSSLLLEALMLP